MRASVCMKFPCVITSLFHPFTFFRTFHVALNLPFTFSGPIGASGLFFFYIRRDTSMTRCDFSVQKLVNAKLDQSDFLYLAN